MMNGVRWELSGKPEIGICSASLCAALRPGHESQPARVVGGGPIVLHCS
jgi:hypothetical protein